MTAILGISAFYHDSAAALIVDGEMIAAAQEERFSRNKHDHAFPKLAIEYCLEEAGLRPEDLDYVAFYDKPMLKFERLLETYLAYAPVGFRSFKKAMPLWLRQKLHLPREMSKGLNHAYKKRYVFTRHHESHAASAFFPCPYEEAAILTMDGVGEWSTATIGVGQGNQIKLTHELRFPHSLGLLYSAFTYFTGFKVNGGEYKLMGLAPYGEPTYYDLILKHLVDLKDDGSFRLDLSYFNYCQGLTMTNNKFARLFGGPPRNPKDEITRREMDMAKSIQQVTEEVMLRTARHIHETSGMKHLCMAGGVALNCVANGRILREGPFDDIWIQPAAGDAGGALGAALFIWHQLLDNERTTQPQDNQKASLLGPVFSDEQIKTTLDQSRVKYQVIEDDEVLCDQIADYINDGKVIGFYQGRMEFGPRALGSRSILGDPRNPEMQKTINIKVKFREGFRPFAPAVLREKVSDYFVIEDEKDHPYMLLVAPVQEHRRNELTEEEKKAEGIEMLKVLRSNVPAITHVDFSARVQTVDAERHGLYHKVISKFHEKTGCPLVVNTSFNLGWAPIVCTPKDALETFMSSDIDVLCVGHQVLTKEEQSSYVSPTLNNQERLQILLGDLWTCVCGKGTLSLSNDQLTCKSCQATYPVSDGIPQLFYPHEAFGEGPAAEEKVKSRYKKAPVPTYQGHDIIRSFIDANRKETHTHLLNEAIPYNSLVLEVGCGTGHLSNFLGISSRRVVGADLCMNSLQLGEAFRKEQELNRVAFVQMNLFKPCFQKHQFDVVICNNALQHTSDPYRGFESLVPLVKPGGYIVVGLHNTYGRILTELRHMFFKPNSQQVKMNKPPYASKHTFGEILGWFARNDLNFVRGLPALTLDDATPKPDELFQPAPRGSVLDRALAQGREFFTRSAEGGFFIMIAQKPHDAAETA